MSTPRRLFEDPRNTYIVENNDPGAFDKRFVGRPGVHREQRCCRDRAPIWQSHLIHDGDEAGNGNRPAYRTEDPLQVQDATGESDNATGRNQMKGYVWVQGPASGYKPDFISPDEWMRWQGVHWVPSPTSPPGLPNPPRWVRLPGERKLRQADGAGRYEFQWCHKCETPLEATWSDVLEGLPVAARGIAMVASYVPVYGTAISFVINTTVSLAEGQSVDQSVIDGIGGALPGQPTSGMVYRAGVAIGRGERIDHVVIDALPVDKSVRDVLKAADEVVYCIASGQRVTEVAYNAVRQHLPPEAQQGMEYARRVVNGENVPQMILSEAERIVVDRVRHEAQGVLDQATGQAADVVASANATANSMFNQYAAEFGYQMALDRLSPEAGGWIGLGMVGGAALKPKQFVGTFGSVAETNSAANDSYETKGKKLIASGIKYSSRPVSEILAGSKFSIVIDFFDSLNSVWTKRAMTYDITDAWRRGFTIAIGVCEGFSARGPGQLAVYQTLAEAGGRAGFDAGQAVQYSRTLHGDLGLVLATETVAQNSSVLQALRAINPGG